MLNLNDVPESQNSNDYGLIPAGTIVRAIITVKPGDMPIPDYGHGNWFKASNTSRAKWMELEFTIIGGQYDRRKFWDRIFVDGDKIGKSGMPEAKEIGLRTLRAIIDSANGLHPTDVSPEAQQRRTINGVGDLNGMEICAKIGVKKGTNGYSDSNRLTVAMTPKDTGYIPRGGGATVGGVQAQAPAFNQQPQMPTATSGAVPAWANR
jgi:hypothetical protein